MNYLDYIDSEEFREKVRENIIEYKIVGGVKTVPNEFITKIQSIDPFEILKLISTEKAENGMEKGSTAFALLNIHIKKVILEEISKINMDVTNSVNQYISVVESFGFKKVYEKDYELSDDGYFSEKDEVSLKKKFNKIYPRGKIVKAIKTDSGYKVEYTKKEKEFIYFNERNGMLFTGDTYDGDKINSANLYFQGKIKNFEKFSELQCSRSYINYTDYHDLNLGVREFLSKSIEEITKFVDLKSNWLEMSPHLYSYLSHDKGASWKEITLNKIKEMPENIQEKLLGDNLIYSNPLLEEYSREKGYNRNYFEVKEFVNSLNNDELNNILARNYLLGSRFSSDHRLLINDEIKLNAIEKGFNIKNLELYGHVIVETLSEKIDSKKHVSQNFELLDKVMSKFNQIEFESSKKELNNGYNDLSKLFEKHSEIRKPKEKNKNKLH